MPRLPGLGFGLASGLGRAALHEATALVTTEPWFEACGLDEELELTTVKGLSLDPEVDASDPCGFADVCEAISTAVPPPAARPAAASAVTSRRLNAIGMLVRPISRSRCEVCPAR